MAGFMNAPRRGPFGGHRINTPMKSTGMPAPAGTGGLAPGPAQGGSAGGINSWSTGSGMQSAPRVGNWDHRFTDGTRGQPKIPAGISTAQNPGGMQQAAPMAYEDGGAVDEDTGAIPDDTSPSDVNPDEGAEPTGNDVLDSGNAGDTMTRNVNAALAKVDAAFQTGRAKFGLTDNFRRSDNIEDSRNEQMGVADMLKARQEAASASRAAKQNFESANSGQDSARLPLTHLWDQPVLAIPGTMQEEAGLNDVGERYEDGGPVKGYDDGGAIEDDYEPSLSDTGDVGTPPSPVDDQQGGNVPQLAAYVQGAGAADPDEVQAYLAKYRHLSPEQATVHALADAAEPADLVPGQELPSYDPRMDSTALLQGYRQHYDHGRAYAYAAANGNPQKPANLHDSVKAANDAFPYVPDGERVHFAVGDQGNVNVSIGGPNGEQRANTTLTPEQYKAFLTQADFDSVYERTPSLMLQQTMSQDIQKAGITTGPTQAQAGNAPQQEFMVGQVGLQGQKGEQPPQGQQQKRVIQGKTDDEGNPLTPDHHPGYNIYTNARGTYYVPEDLDARSQALTGGWISREQDRQQWLNEQMQQGVKNEIDMTKARNPLGVQELRNQGQIARTKYASDLKAGWEDRRTQAMIMNNLDKIRAQHSNEQARNAANIARSMLIGGVDPETVPDIVKKMTNVDMSRLLNLEDNTPQSPNAGNSRNPPPMPQYGGKNTQVQSPQAPQTVFKDGKLWYKTPRGTWSDSQQ